MRTFDFATTRNLLVSIIREVGVNHVGTIDGETGNGCEYIDGKTRLNTGRLTPSCIVGYFFDRIGFLGLMLAGEFGQEGACAVNSPIWSKAEGAGLFFSDEAKALLLAAQQFQDDGMVWGRALLAAIEKVQNNALIEFREGNPDLFSTVANSDATALAAQVDEPLAEWEKELLGQN